MTSRNSSRNAGRKPPQPLDQPRLDALALAYVGRFATTRAKLAEYLGRKLHERGWDGPRPPDPAALAERLAGLGYIDDAAFAVAKARSLGQRGFGGRRVSLALRTAGIGEDDRREADEVIAANAVGAALRFAERRRLGPFADSAKDPKLHERALAAMVRAGHGFELSRRIVDLPGRPGPEDIEELEALFVKSV